MGVVRVVPSLVFENMKYAIDIFGDRILPTPGDKGTCPLCGGWVAAKCGEINIWHWAHESRADCDTWSDGETEWHRWWKSLVVPSAQEVTKGPHRADIVGDGGTVLELQRSPICPAEIRERERFYRDMVWLFDAHDFAKRFILRRKTGKDGNKFVTFRWKHPRSAVIETTMPTFLDLGGTRFGIENPIFQIRKIYHNKTCGGWGELWTHEEFILEHLSEVLTDEMKAAI